ncbi:Fic family protein [Helicobacter cetorum]|uniref:Fic family protein n=1 Tax=Helicobacter cetorum TaxID=138563 RepID=UPI000CF053C3|nr:Fic family protein [Helicobacter cetorum]
MNYKELLEFNDYAMDLTIRMAHHSTAIEGNTLTQNETASILIDGVIPKAMSEREYYEVKNFQNFIPILLKSLQEKQIIDNEYIKHIHSIIMKHLIENCGKFKTIANVVLGANFEPTAPFKVPMALKDWCDNLYYQLNNAKDDTQKLEIIMDSHIKFEHIHPFSDGNGRTGRMLIFYSVLEQDLVPFVISKDNKKDYILAMREENVPMLVDIAKEAQEVERKRAMGFLEKYNNQLHFDNKREQNRTISYPIANPIIKPNPKHPYNNRFANNRNKGGKDDDRFGL